MLPEIPIFLMGYNFKEYKIFQLLNDRRTSDHHLWVLLKVMEMLVLNESKYSRMDQVKFVEDSL